MMKELSTLILASVLGLVVFICLTNFPFVNLKREKFQLSDLDVGERGGRVAYLSKAGKGEIFSATLNSSEEYDTPKKIISYLKCRDGIFVEKELMNYRDGKTLLLFNGRKHRGCELIEVVVPMDYPIAGAELEVVFD